MPRPTASAGPCSTVSTPCQRIVPESAAKMPETTLISVDLPAPLSPTRATTSDGRTSKRTSVSACTAPNRLLMPRSSNSGPGRSTVIRPSRSSDGGGRGSRRRTSGWRLLDACALAGRREFRRADLGHRIGAVELVSDDRVLDRLGAGDLAVDGDGDRDEEDRRHVGRAVVHDLAVRRARRGRLALDEVAGEARRRLGLRLDGLVHGHELVAREDALDGRDLGVLAGHELRLRIDAA